MLSQGRSPGRIRSHPELEIERRGCKGLGDEIARAVREAKSNVDSGPSTAHKENDLQARNLEVADNT